MRLTAKRMMPFSSKNPIFRLGSNESSGVANNKKGSEIMLLTRALKLTAILLCLVSVGASAALGQAGETSQSPEPQGPPPVAEMTCGEIEFMFGDEAMEVESSYLAIWAYGVRIGATGMDFEKYPISKDGLTAFVSRVIEVCDADSEKLFVKAILE